jgi:hypothetical protein
VEYLAFTGGFWYNKGIEWGYIMLRLLLCPYVGISSEIEIVETAAAAQATPAKAAPSDKSPDLKAHPPVPDMQVFRLLAQNERETSKRKIERIR